jgi:hypothetical protein
MTVIALTRCNGHSARVQDQAANEWQRAKEASLEAEHHANARADERDETSGSNDKPGKRRWNTEVTYPGSGPMGAEASLVLKIVNWLVKWRRSGRQR